VGIVADDVERVRAAVSIVDVIGAEVQLRRVGRNHVGLCPFHSEKSPSFNVQGEKGFYRCFGCGASGDVFRYVMDREHVDFPAAVERLAGQAGISLRYTTSGEDASRSKRKKLVEAMTQAVDWYHQRLLTAADAGPARGYLRSRGITGEQVRQFRLGWAPDDWDSLARALRLPDEVLRDAGLGFTNKAGRSQDAFRKRLLFPIFDERGDAVAFGGRKMPGDDGPKYKNSQTSPGFYDKSRTLYGLNWAKDAVVAADQVIVCEGYTDVMGFHRAGVPRAVATCGTALTGDHVRLMRRFATKVVLAFDADGAGQAAADRFYAWEKEFGIDVHVARLPSGADPGDLAVSDPDALQAAVADATPFLAFRLERSLAASPARTPEERAKAAEAAMAVIAEHPSPLVREQYASQVAVRLGLPGDRLVDLARRGVRGARVAVAEPRPVREAEASVERTVLWLLVHEWARTAPWVVPELFTDPVHQAALDALGASDDLHVAVEQAAPEAAELLRTLAVEPIESHSPELDAFTLIRKVALRVHARVTPSGWVGAVPTSGQVRTWIDHLPDGEGAASSASELLAWIAAASATGSASMTASGAPSTERAAS
jgi:DNA primase